MASIIRQKRAAVEVALRRNRESTYTEPIIKRGGQQKTPEEIAEIKSYLSDFYRTIYKRSDECQAVLREHPNTVGVHYANLVDKQISYEDFWQRYYFRCSEERIIAEWDHASNEARKARAVRVEEIQQSLQKGLRNIHDTFEVAAAGGSNAPAESSSSGASALPPMLGQDTPDVKPTTTTTTTTTMANAVIVEKKKISEVSVTPGRMSPAPKTAAGEATEEEKSTLMLTPKPGEESPPKSQTLQEMMIAANEVEKSSPRSRQVRVVSHKVEPKVVSFWKNSDDGGESSRTGDVDFSTPDLTKKDTVEGDTPLSDAKENTAFTQKTKKLPTCEEDEKAKNRVTVPHDLKRTGSKVADRESSTPKKRKVDEPSSQRVSHDERALAKVSGFSNSAVILLILPALIGALIAMLFNSDLACAAAQPGMNLSNENFYSEAPFWAPPAIKRDIFGFICPGRVRTSLEWTSNAKLYRLTLRDLGALEEGDSRPLFVKRNLQSGTVSPIFISVISKKGSKEKINAPWAL